MKKILKIIIIILILIPLFFGSILIFDDGNLKYSEQIEINTSIDLVDTLFKDIYSKPWIRDYALAVSKTMLGEARGKFNTIAGPQGGTTLNGAELKQQGLAEMEKLDQEIGNFAEGGTPHSFVIG